MFRVKVTNELQEQFPSVFLTTARTGREVNFCNIKQLTPMFHEIGHVLECFINNKERLLLVNMGWPIERNPTKSYGLKAGIREAEVFALSIAFVKQLMMPKNKSDMYRINQEYSKIFSLCMDADIDVYGSICSNIAYQVHGENQVFIDLIKEKAPQYYEELRLISMWKDACNYMEDANVSS